MRTVAAVIDQGALTFDLAIPCEVFGVDRRDIVDPWYEFLRRRRRGRRRCGRRPGSRSTRPTGSPTSPGPTRRRPGLVRSRRSAVGGALRSAAGGRRARRQDRLAVHGRVRARRRRPARRPPGDDALALRRPPARAVPRVEVDPNVLYVEDGGVFTSAGTAAGMDLCLHLVALDHGADVAVRVARRIVMPPYRAGGQAQYVEQRIDAEPAAEPLSARPRLGAEQAGLRDLRRRPRPAGGDEPADADAPVPRRHGPAARRVAAARATTAGAAAARDAQTTR